MRTDGSWYDFSADRGGGALELVMALEGQSNLYDAGRRLVELGVSHVTGGVRQRLTAAAATRGERGKEGSKATPRGRNKPITQDLTPHLRIDHPEFAQRGIPADVLELLGAGYLPAEEWSTSPLKRRLVFQIRGVRQQQNGTYSPIILSHIGRATSPEQEELAKWYFYEGFRKSLELYNLDLALLHPLAQAQARATGAVVIVEGAFDVAKLMAAGIFNVIATLGSHVSDGQVRHFRLLRDQLGVELFRVFFDRDQGPSEKGGATKAVDRLSDVGKAEAFDWQQRFLGRDGYRRPIPDAITDPCEMSLDRLRVLRRRGLL